ncbi:MAG: glucose-6-phosphate dehydrogenase [Bacteroidota bacterium]
MDSSLFILLGATGDLAKRKLIPAIYRGLIDRERAGDADTRPAILGVGRSGWDDQQMRDTFREALEDEDLGGERADAWCDTRMAYVQVDSTDELGDVFARASELEEDLGLSGNRIYYLAIPPSAFPKTIQAIGEQDEAEQRGGWTRLVVEKPFGHDLASARELNEIVHAHFAEAQVYRIDHYLGKETVQNLLVFRFANALFEALWNREHIDRVEVTVAESIGAEGRAGYFDTSGTLRDMVQNHLTQLVTLVAMEPPARFDAQSIRREKIKVLHSIAPIDEGSVVFGQYTGDDGAGAEHEGYQEHEDTPPESDTETFVALRLYVENWRWQGVPFVLRTGKRMPERLTEISVHFRCPPVQLFGGPNHCSISRNVLRIQLQPHEGFTLGVEVKRPGDGFDLSSQEFDFDYEHAFGALPSAYETLLADVVAGDQTLFVHADETEAAWSLFEPLLEAGLPVQDYASGTWGPVSAASMFVADRREPTPEDEFAV